VPKLVVTVLLLEEANVKLADRDMFDCLEITSVSRFLYGANVKKKAVFGMEKEKSEKMKIDLIFVQTAYETRDSRDPGNERCF
jgi:hypothetical protein